MIENDHLGDWSPEKDCCLPTTDLLMTSVSQMIIFNQGMLLLGSNHFLNRKKVIAIMQFEKYVEFINLKRIRNEEIQLVLYKERS